MLARPVVAGENCVAPVDGVVAPYGEPVVPSDGHFLNALADCCSNVTPYGLANRSHRPHASGQDCTGFHGVNASPDDSRWRRAVAEPLDR